MRNAFNDNRPEVGQPESKNMSYEEKDYQRKGETSASSADRVIPSGIMKKKEEEISALIHDMCLKQRTAKQLINEIGIQQQERKSESVSGEKESPATNHHEFLNQLIRELHELNNSAAEINNHLIGII